MQKPLKMLPSCGISFLLWISYFPLFSKENPYEPRTVQSTTSTVQLVTIILKERATTFTWRPHCASMHVPAWYRLTHQVALDGIPEYLVASHQHRRGDQHDHGTGKREYRGICRPRYYRIALNSFIRFSIVGEVCSLSRYAERVCTYNQGSFINTTTLVLTFIAIDTFKIEAA